jgi:parallel beta-helix repeat protein
VCDNASFGLLLHTGGNPMFHDNAIRGNGDGGIHSFEDGNGIVERNDIGRHKGADGIKVTQGGVSVFRGNKVHDCTVGVCVEDGGLGVFEHNDIFSNVDANIHVTDESSKPYFRQNRVHGCVEGEGILLEEGCKCRIEECMVYGNGTGISVTSGSDPRVFNCSFTENLADGVSVTDGGLGTYEGNTIMRNKDDGVSVDGEGSAPIVNNNMIAKNNGNGVILFDGATGTVTNCYVNSNKESGIEVDACFTRVSLNRIRSNGKAGLQATDDSKCELHDNQLMDNNLEEDPEGNSQVNVDEEAEDEDDVAVYFRDNRDKFNQPLAVDAGCRYMPHGCILPQGCKATDGGTRPRVITANLTATANIA